MRRLSAFVLAAGLILVLGGAPQARAGQYFARFTGTVVDLETAGFCNTSDFSSQCPLSGVCDCITLQGRATGSIIGRTSKNNPVTINITYEAGAQGQQVGWTGKAQCAPIYGSAHIHGNRDIEEVDFTGSMCMLDPSVKPQRAPLAGTWGLTDLSGIHAGFGKVTGSLNLSNFNATQTLTFTGTDQ
jgi:hypothetical protein